MDDDYRKLKHGLSVSLVGAFDAAKERDADLVLIREYVFATIGQWWKDHPGIEDHTVECVTCHKPTTKANLIEPLCRADAPTYLCERCCEVRRQVIANSIG